MTQWQEQIREIEDEVGVLEEEVVSTRLPKNSMDYYELKCKIIEKRNRITIICIRECRRLLLCGERLRNKN